jgi:hypothetical protein
MSANYFIGTRLVQPDRWRGRGLGGPGLHFVMDLSQVG